MITEAVKWALQEHRATSELLYLAHSVHGRGEQTYRPTRQEMGLPSRWDRDRPHYAAGGTGKYRRVREGDVPVTKKTPCRGAVGRREP